MGDVDIKKVRFSDEKLKELYMKVEQLEVQFGEMLVREKDIFASLERNARSLEELTEYHSEYSTQLTDLAKLYSDMQAAVKIGIGVQRFGAWLIKWPLIGTGAFAVYKALEEYFQNLG